MSAQDPSTEPRGWRLAPRPEDEIRSTYLLGPEDQITVRALNAEELGDRPVPIGNSGYINLPMVGRVRAAGLTVEQLETELSARLERYLEDPKVAVSVSEFRSQPVSVVGAVTTPGVYQLRGGRKLVEVLSMAGGLRPDAGPIVRITRKLEWGRVPLPKASDDTSGEFSVAEVNIRSVMEARDGGENILLRPHDVITVPRAEMVYVMGEVARPGGFVLTDRETVSALQAISLAGGLGRLAAPQSAKILRNAGAGSTQRAEIAINLKAILAGKSGDVELQPDDILFVPNNAAKNAGLRAVEAAIQFGTGMAIWGRR